MINRAEEGTTSVTAEWVNRTWIGFDTETTGVSPVRDRIVTAAAVKRHGGLGPEQPEDYGPDAAPPLSVKTWLADPGIPIPDIATSVHGVTTQQARENGAPIAEVVDQICEHLAKHMAAGRIVVVFNAAFDIPLLETEAERHGVRSLSQRLDGRLGPVADPLVLDRGLDRYRRGKRTLSDMAPVYGVPLPSDTHQAHVDSLLTLDIFAALLRRFPALQDKDGDQLMEFQREKHAIWAAGMEEFLASKGRATHISREWL